MSPPPRPPSQKQDEAPELDADGNPIAKEDDDEEEEQANMSLAAMEAALKPRCSKRSTASRRITKALRDAGQPHLGHAERGQFLFSKQEETYQKLRSEIVELVNSLHLHNNRIEALIDQLYGINKRIMSDRQRHGEAGRSGAHQPPRVHRGISRPRARP